MWRRDLAKQEKKPGRSYCNNLGERWGSSGQNDRHEVMKSGQVLSILWQDCWQDLRVEWMWNMRERREWNIRPRLLAWVTERLKWTFTGKEDWEKNRFGKEGQESCLTGWLDTPFTYPSGMFSKQLDTGCGAQKRGWGSSTEEALVVTGWRRGGQNWSQVQILCHSFLTIHLHF